MDATVQAVETPTGTSPRKRSELPAVIYGLRCCICKLRERALVEAAHIVPDRLPDGVPIVQNGMAMCPNHHRAFDRARREDETLPRPPQEKDGFFRETSRAVDM